MNKKYIVLDLDSTLVSSDEDFKMFKQIVDNRKNNEYFLYDRVHDFLYINEKSSVPMWTLLRPYTREFIYFCLSYFDGVILWSAGQKHYVHSIKNILFPTDISQPFLVLTSDDTNFIKKSIINKPLTKVFEQLKTATPQNTLVVDDRSDTFSLNHHNGILIPKFEPNDLHEINKDDATLLQLMGWLCTPEVLNCTDYRTLDKSKIFNISVEEYATRINKIT
jgi:hypothetical protein